jgi:nucleotide-binding universal stress UspA family protein
MNAPLSKLSCDNFGIKANRLLLPIDLAKCPPEIFPLANGFTKPFGGQIVLLHVLQPGMPTLRVGGSDIDLRRSKRHLEHLAREYLRPATNVEFRVRVGVPHEEILAEATTSEVDLILLPTFTPSIWRKLAGSSYGETSRHLVASGSCRMFVVDVRTHFNCFRRWANGESCGQYAA